VLIALLTLLIKDPPRGYFDTEKFEPVPWIDVYFITSVVDNIPLGSQIAG
jgi:hypothetical protein